MLCATPCQATPADFAKPYAVTQPVRLAITPVMDGKIDDEEWDTLSTDGGCQSYFQWEPETLYWAAKLADGQDAVLSLDTKSDGWLVGDDNLEFRVTLNAGQPVMSVRRLDATDPNGPKWVNAGVLTESVKLVSAKTDNGWSVEGSYTPPAPESPAPGHKFGIRIDSVPTGSDVGQAYQPRNMAFLTLQYDLGQNLPSGFSWRPDFLVRNVPVDDSFKVKYGFKRTEPVEFTTVDYRAEGHAKPLMATGSKPFPEWDKKGRAGEEYATIISKGAPVGYRILRLSLVNKEGATTVLRSSFKISDLVEFDINLPKSLKLDPEARIIRGSVDVRSNGLKRVNGAFTFRVPDAWTVTRGKTTNFTIYHSRGTSKVPVEFIIPKDTVGVFPLTFTAVIGEKTVTKTLYLPVGQP